MSDLISRTALLADIECTIAESGCVNHTGEIMDCIRYAPAGALKPGRHAHWRYDAERCEIKCAGRDGCYEPMRFLAYLRNDYFGGGYPDYCPHCGARMDGADGEDEL